MTSQREGARTRLMRFETKALLGYFLLTLVLVVGMSLSFRSLSSAMDEQIARLRAAEREITLVERLRWRSEVIVADGRGYLLSGDPTLLRELEESVVEFDRNINALNTRTDAFVAEVEQAARSFKRVQADLVSGRQRSQDTRSLFNRFESELLPLRRELHQSLTRLVTHDQVALQDFYEAAATTRDRLELRLGILRALLVMAGLAVAWYFSKLLGRSYSQERKAKETARKALAARDEVMGIVAHDLRNPLGAITMKAALLQKTTDFEKVKQQSKSIGNVVMRMEYLIKTMLDVTTIDAGRFSVSPAPCAVQDLLRETEAMFDQLATSKQIRLEILERVPGLIVCAERERVLQVLSNLMGNALKFTPPGGHVILSARREGMMARFAVLDTGPGIPHESRSHVFERFWKKDMPGKKGTGLGLFIAKGIVEAHGGQIGVDSAPDPGATFYFTLPLVDRRTEEERNPAAVAEPALRVVRPAHREG
jgi:signal transduction histidine kinase